MKSSQREFLHRKVIKGKEMGDKCAKCTNLDVRKLEE